MSHGSRHRPDIALVVDISRRDRVLAERKTTPIADAFARRPAGVAACRASDRRRIVNENGTCRHDREPDSA